MKIQITNTGETPIPFARVCDSDITARLLDPGETVAGHAVTINVDKHATTLFDGLGRSIFSHQHRHCFTHEIVP